MNLSPFSDIPFDDDDAFADFQLSHGLAHDRIAQAMFSNGNVYNTYPLYDTPKNDTDWLLTHMQEHQSIYSLLFLSGLPDLASADFHKEDEFNDWQLLHMQVHTRVNSTLGIE